MSTGKIKIFFISEGNLDIEQSREQNGRARASQMKAAHHSWIGFDCDFFGQLKSVSMAAKFMLSSLGDGEGVRHRDERLPNPPRCPVTQDRLQRRFRVCLSPLAAQAYSLPTGRSLFGLGQSAL